MRPPKLLIVVVWALAIASVAGYLFLKLTPRAPANEALSILYPAPAFTLTDQNGQPFSSDQLKGKVWVGFLFLTHCPTGACPVMVGKMARLQESLPDERIHFVSFSVDPERDTPEAMLDYARKVGETEVSPRWHLLTGSSAEEMKDFARRMKLIVDDSFGHSTVFLLVDASGNVRGAYGNDDPEGMARLKADAERLLAQ